MYNSQWHLFAYLHIKSRIGMKRNRRKRKNEYEYELKSNR